MLEIPDRFAVGRFLSAHIRADRFDDRCDGFWSDYQDILIDSAMERLSLYGIEHVSHHDSRNGYSFTYGWDLNPVYDYTEHRKQDMRLTHLF